MRTHISHLRNVYLLLRRYLYVLSSNLNYDRTVHHILATQLVLDCKTNAQSRITHTLWTRFHTGLDKPIAMKHLDSHNSIFVYYILIMTILMLVIFW